MKLTPTMKLTKPLLAALATGTLAVASVGAWAALPAGGTSPATMQLNATTAALDSAASPTPPAGVAVPPGPCETWQWPDSATGQPAGLSAGGAKGFYLWHNDQGWHLEVTHRSDDHVVFSGWISTNGTIAFQRVDDEHNDLTREGKGGHVLAFDLNNYGGVDGVHFETHCADQLQFHLFVDGRPAGVEQVFVGHGSAHPPAVPFTIDRLGVH